MISVKHLKKVFKSHQALDDVSFTIEKGDIFGLLGPSGSGKTTTINILTGQITPDAGEAEILDKSVSDITNSDLEQIGLLTEKSGYYEKLTLYDNLLFFCKHYKKTTGYLDELLQEVDLLDSKKIVAEKLSTGMKQRMLLVRALLNTPTVLFLDEPTSGLDPTTSRRIHELLLKLRSKGTTIFLTTHDMNEASFLCDQIALLNNGKIVSCGNPQSIIQKYNNDKKVKITYRGGRDEFVFIEELSSLKDIYSIEGIHSCEPTLEDVFIMLTGGELNV